METAPEDQSGNSYRIEEVMEEEGPELGNVLYDSTYCSAFFQEKLSLEEWKEIIGNINNIRKSAGLLPLVPTT